MESSRATGDVKDVVVAQKSFIKSFKFKESGKLKLYFNNKVNIQDIEKLLMTAYFSVLPALLTVVTRRNSLVSMLFGKANPGLLLNVKATLNKEAKQTRLDIDDRIKDSHPSSDILGSCEFDYVYLSIEISGNSYFQKILLDLIFNALKADKEIQSNIFMGFFKKYPEQLKAPHDPGDSKAALGTTKITNYIKT